MKRKADRVEVLADTNDMVELVMPDGAVPMVRDGSFMVVTWRKESEKSKKESEQVLFSRPCRSMSESGKPCRSRWTLSGSGKLKGCDRDKFSVDLTELAVNPVMSSRLAVEATRCCPKFDVMRYLADHSRAELAKLVMGMVAKMQRLGCGKVFVVYRGGTKDVVIPVVIPADNGGCFGAVSFHHVGMVGCKE